LTAIIATKTSLKNAASNERLSLTGLSKSRKISATVVSHVSVMSILVGVADAAPLGAATKMSKYKTPAILALRRGDAAAIRSIVTPLLILVFLMASY